MKKLCKTKSKKPESVEPLTKRIRTYIKFEQGDKSGRPVGYVTKEGVRGDNGKRSWKGVRSADQRHKKVVIADWKIAGMILENILYKCTLIPMANSDGFVAISAEPVRFPATIETIRNKHGFIISVKFGQKNITYNPKYPADPKYSSLEKVIDTLRNRPDLENADKVVDTFIEAVEIAQKFSDV